MFYSKKILLILGFVLSIGNICAMEPENWEIEKNLRREIVKQLKIIHKSFDPKDGFTKQLNRLALIDEGIIAQGVLLSDDVYTSIGLLLKDNSLQNKPLTIINFLNKLIEKFNTFIGNINVSLGNMDELIANAQANHNVVITKAELKKRLNMLLLYAYDILSDLNGVVTLTKESRSIQGFHDRW